MLRHKTPNYFTISTYLPVDLLFLTCRSNILHIWHWNHHKQECIPVGCVPPAAIAIFLPHLPPATHTPAMHIPLPCTPPATHAPPCHAHPPAMHIPLPCMLPLPSMIPPSVDRILDTRPWKYYLAATSLWAVII